MEVLDDLLAIFIDWSVVSDANCSVHDEIHFWHFIPFFVQHFAFFELSRHEPKANVVQEL